MPPTEGLLGLDSSLPFSNHPLQHVFILIHGAGDPYIDHQPWLSSLQTCINHLQTNYNLVSQRLQNSSRASTPHQQSQQQNNPPSALFLPVEWHRPAFEAWQSHVSIAQPAAAPPSQAVRRALAETVGDVLMMASPFWTQAIAKLLHQQITDQLAAVKRNRPNFSGAVSIVAHSISAMLVTQLLQTRSFTVDIDAVVFLGCPIPAYSALAPGAQQSALATIRNLRNRVRFFNVYHPMDPVAFRLEPFVMDREQLTNPVRVAAQKRTFWDDVGLFWDDLAYNLWSLMFATNRQQTPSDPNNTETAHNQTLHDIWPLFGSGPSRNRRNSAPAADAWRHSGYIVATGEHAQNDDTQLEPRGSQVMLSGRIDFELRDGMSTAPFDVVASWGAVKAHQYYWQSVDVAQLLLDIGVTSESALAQRPKTHSP